MKVDFTRNTFRALKHFSGVLVPQGRALLDADWNEQAAIQVHYLRALAADVIGEHGGPLDNWGFGITELTLTTPVLDDFRIGTGHYYVDGILCEVDPTPVPIVVKDAANGLVEVQSWTVDGVQFDANQYVEVFDDAAPGSSPTLAQIKAADQTHRTVTLSGLPATTLPALATSTAMPRIRRVVTYSTQPDYPVPPDETLETRRTGTFQVYLDVWERQITCVEDDSIREVALGGPDTAARAKVVWQVKLTGPDIGGACLTPRQLRDRLRGGAAGRLKAMAQQDSQSTDPCIVPPDARYRGAENQLYRVEIHRAGPAWNGSSDTETNAKTNAATFKWSRENGSVIFPIVGAPVVSDGTTNVTLETLGRDDRLSLEEGDWVEVQDDAYVLHNVAGKLLQIQAIDRTSMTVTLSGTPDPDVDPSRHPLLRRWDHKEGVTAEGGLQLASDGAALIIEGSDGVWLSLEDGVQIQFQKGPPANSYNTGDYWLIPARTATDNVEWPTEPGKDSSGNPIMVPLALPPAGIQHHYAPLALLTLSEGTITSGPTECRKKFETLVELTTQ
jgi:hypothetical protein